MHTPRHAHGWFHLHVWMVAYVSTCIIKHGRPPHLPTHSKPCAGTKSMMSEACRTLPWSVAMEEHMYRDVFAMHVLILHDVLRQLQRPLRVCVVCQDVQWGDMNQWQLHTIVSKNTGGGRHLGTPTPSSDACDRHTRALPAAFCS